MVRLWVIVGGLLLVLVGAAFLAPVFIDWERYRDRFEAEASTLLGREVRVGAIGRARLLPFPSLTFEDVRVVGDDGRDLVTVERFAFDAELAPFMRGEILVFDARLDAPVVEARLGEDGTIDLRPSARNVDPGSVAIERLTVANGAVRVVDPDGRTFEADDIDLSLAADTLLGPWRAAGALTTGGERFTLDAATGLYEPALRDGVRLSVTLDGRPLPAPVTAFGTATFAGGRLAWEGEFQSARADGATDGQPFVLTGEFEAGPRRVAIPQYRLAIGTREDPYVVTGEGSLAGGAEPGFTFLARGQRLDTARLGEADGTAATERLDALRRLVTRAPRPGLDGAIDVSLPAIVFADTTVRDVRLRALAEDGDWRIDRLALDLPGRTSVDLSGRLAADGSGAFEGRVAAVSLQPTGIAAWLGNPTLDALRGLERVSVEADLANRDGVQRLDDLRVSLGDETIAGAVTVPSEGPIAATLEAGALDLDAVRAVLVALTGSAAPVIPADLTFAVEEASHDGVTASGLAGKVAIDAERIVLDGVAARALRGAALTIDGTLALTPGGAGEGASELRVTIEADRPGPVLELLAERARSDWARALASRSRQIGPLSAAVDLAWLDTASVGFEADARAGGVRWVVGGSLSPERNDDELLLGLADANAEVEGPSGRVLRQLGIAASGDGRPGTLTLAHERTASGSRLDAAAAVPGDGGSDGKADALTLTLLRTGEDALADLRFEVASLASVAPLAGLDWSGIVAGADGRVEATRTGGLWSLSLEEVQVGDALVTGRLVGEGARWQGEVATGVIDVAALAPLLVRAGEGGIGVGTERLPDLDVVVAVEARALALPDAVVASDATFQLSSTGDSVALEGLEARLAEGRLTGEASLRETLGDVIVSGRVALTGADITALPLPEGIRLEAGTLAATGTFEATGRTVADLLGSATGAGEALLIEPVLEGLDPFALARIYETVDAETEALEGPVVEAAVRAALPEGRFAPPAFAADWSLSGGTVRATLAEAVDEDTVLSGDATADLAEGDVVARALLRLAVPDDRAAGGAPVIRLRWEGDRAVYDTASLTGFLNLRAFEIERDRVASLRAALLEEQRLRRETLLFARREREERAAEEAAAERARAAAREASVRREGAAGPQLDFAVPIE